MVTIEKVRQANRSWSSPKNKRFFGDVSYEVLCGLVTEKPYLVRLTYAWTDMFEQEKKLHYRINHIKDNLEIGGLVDEIFWSIESAKAWLKIN